MATAGAVVAAAALPPVAVQAFKPMTLGEALAARGLTIQAAAAEHVLVKYYGKYPKYFGGKEPPTLYDFGARLRAYQAA